MKYIFALLVLVRFCAFSQELKLEEIMKGPELTGREPENYHWTNDGKQLVFDWNPENEPISPTWIYTTGSKTPVRLDGKQPRLYDRYNTGSFFAEDDAVKYADTKGTRTVFTGNVQDFQSIHGGVYFRSGTRCFTYTVAAGLQLRAEITASEDHTSKELPNLEKQQLELFSTIRRDTLVKNTRQRKSADMTPKIYTQKGQTIVFTTISGDLSYIVARIRTNSDEKLTRMPEYVTASGEVEFRYTRSKVTNREEKSSLVVLDLSSGMSNVLNEAALSGVRKRPEYFSDYGISGDYDLPKNLIYQQPIPNNAHEMLMDVRSCDNKDRWIILLDCSTAGYKELSHQHDEAWIGGPGISGWDESGAVLGWLDENTVYYQDEKSGFSHLYKYNVRSAKEMQLTNGNFEVYDALLSKNKKTFYLLLNKIHPGVRNGYSLDIASGKLTPLFEGYFGIAWQLSPDEKYWAIGKSEMLHPLQLFIVENKPGAKWLAVQETETSAYKSLHLQQPEVISFAANDGKQVYARLYKPEHSNGAAIEFVHGAGYLQNAHFYWSYYQREMLFHQLLSELGYTVIDVDYRASEGYGRDFRTAIYRDMGNRDLQDFVDAKKLLVGKYGIDPAKVGIYGGSYGGFITLMALFKTNEFSCGAALRSVTDWAHYNQEYTSNILNYPETDSIAYRRSSPIYFAEGLQKPLLMAHGVEDDNVHFQDIVRLNQRLIELRKNNYWLAVYPVEGHGFINTDSWIDEYSRILELFRANLENGPK